MTSKRLALTGLCLWAGVVAADERRPVDDVSPWMGVLDRGNTVIGPQMPWGSVNPSPDTPDGYTSGYNANRPIRGFSQLHVSGTGGPGKYGQFLLSPQIGLAVAEDGHDSFKTNEVATASAYRVELMRYGIRCEVTPTRHAALYRFVYPASDDAHLLFDLGHTVTKDANMFAGGYAETARVAINPDMRTLTGSGTYWGGWSAEPFTVYFAAEVDRPFTVFGTWADGAVHAGQTLCESGQIKQRIGAYLQIPGGGPAAVKIAVSFKSVEQARAYLAQEIGDWDFGWTERAARDAWDRCLEKIRVDGAGETQRRLFYTCLQKTMLMPRDRTGDNPRWASDEPYWDDHMCVWDTWKTLFPLHVLINESKVRDNIRSFIDRFRHNGEVKDGFIAGNDRRYEWVGDDKESWLGEQGGNDVVNVMADAYVKGVKGIDWRAAYEVVRASAEAERAPAYRIGDRGWVPFRQYAMGLYCSRSLEFSYNDFCTALMAGGLGLTQDAARYRARSRQWTSLWNPELESHGFKGFVAPRRLNGEWPAYDPESDRIASAVPASLDRVFYEGSSWVYSFVLPHDFSRLIALCGGAEAYCARLQYALANGEHLFYLVTDGKVSVARAPGLIDFSNEPSFLTPYSFIYAGRPDLTARWVRKNLAAYTEKGFPGDEDSGAMSAWYIFASLGFFPNAGQDLYLISGPAVPYAELTMENGKRIIIRAPGASEKNSYVQSVTLNGRPLDRAWFRHTEIADGAVFEFVMGEMPSAWGTTLLPGER